MKKEETFAEKTEVEVVKEAIEKLLAEHPTVVLNIQHTIQVAEAPKQDK